MVKNTERSMSVRIYKCGWLRDIEVVLIEVDLIEVDLNEVELENMELMSLCDRDQDISGFI